MFLKILQYLQENTVSESLFNKVENLQPCRFIKNRFQQRYLPVNIAKFLRTRTLKKICERLLLTCVKVWNGAFSLELDLK